MRYLLISLTLVLCACSTPSGVSSNRRESEANPQPSSPPLSSSAAKQSIESASRGEAYALRLSSETLEFCDEDASHALDLKSGLLRSAKAACPKKEEANTACSGLAGDPSVRSIPNQPDEIVDLKGSSYPLKGRVQDCVADGSLLAIITNSSLFWIDPANPVPHEVPSSGGDRVALGAGWIAWTQGTRIFAKPIR